jgi:bifunctional non-homologous end joining protein LigD
MTDALAPYRHKRDFGITSEPRGRIARAGPRLSFVVQKHAATRLHYDFRLELQGTLKSWAIPKGPSLDPADKRMAIHVEDHPLDYASFEGEIAPKQYGAGHVIVWDRGSWEPAGDPQAGYRAGKLKFVLHGEKLRGGWTLVRIHGREGERQEPWLLIKERDAEARPAGAYSVVDAQPNSVLSGRALPDKQPAPARAARGAAGVALAKPVRSAATGEAQATRARSGSREARAGPSASAATERASPAPAGPRPSGASPAARADDRRADAAGAAARPSALRVTHPERVVDARSGARKRDVVDWYAAAARRMLTHLAGRPVALLRAPSGLAGPHVFQKHRGTLRIEGLKELPLRLDPGHPPLIEIDRVETLVSAAQFNTLEFHTWNALAARIDKPDRMTFDLDPGEGIAWRAMQEAAGLVRELLEGLGLVPFLKTSGGKGLHVVVPLEPEDGWSEVREFSRAVVERLARLAPERFVAKSGPKNRVGRIFVDDLRNGRGATTVAAWSLRARPGLGVSVPCAWDELGDLGGGDHWTLATAHQRLASALDPWSAYAGSAKTLGGARRALERST